MTRASILLWLLLAGCGDDAALDGGSGDGGSLEDAGLDGGEPPGDAGLVLEPEAPMPPAPPEIPWLDESAPDLGLGLTPPALPDHAPCPEGWTELAGTPTLCEPARDTCAEGTLQAPGDHSCHPPGTACPSHPFPDEVPSGAIFVDDDASAPGMGTRDAPFFRVEDALASAPPGATLILAPGRYQAELDHGAALTVLGTCASETTLAGSPTRPHRVSESLTLENLRVEAAGALAAGTGALVLRGVRVDAPFVSVTLDLDVTMEDVVHRRDESVREGGTVRAIRSVIGAISGKRVELVGSFVDGGVDAVSGSARESLVVGTRAIQTEDRFDVEDCVLEASLDAFLGSGELRRLRAEGGSVRVGGEVVAEDLVVRGALRAVSVLPERRFEGTRVWLEGTENAPSALGSGGGVVVLRDAHLREAFRGLSATGGSEVDAERIIVTNVVEGAYVLASTVRLADLEVREMRRDELFAGAGLHHSSGALEVEGLWIHDGDDLGIFAGAPLRARRVVVADLRGDPLDGSTKGSALRAFEEGDATVDELVVRRVDDYGVDAFEGGQLTLRDVSIQGVDVTSTSGAAVDVSGVVDLRRARIEGVVGRGLRVSDALVLRDVVITDVRPNEFGGLPIGGNAIAVFGASVDAARIEVRRATEVGISLFAGSRLVASDVVLADTRERPCAADVCEGFELGVGLGAYDATGEMRRFVIESNDLAGVQLVDADLCLESGVVRDQPIGLNAQGEVDLEKVRVGVLYDNEQNLASRDIRPPDPGAP